MQITNSVLAENVIHNEMMDLDHEEAWLIFLTRSNTVIGTEMVSKGTLNSTSVDCRTILRRVLLNNAGGIIIAHNHPSGNPQPSSEDIRFTERLKDACKLMDISLIDHIIVSCKSFFSFAEEKEYKY